MLTNANTSDKLGIVLLSLPPSGWAELFLWGVSILSIWVYNNHE